MLKYGFSRRCITPSADCKVSLAGYFNKRWQVGKLDDIYVYAAAFSDGKEAAVLCSVDSVAVPFALLTAVREGCKDIAGLKPENILICATHSHTCPNLRPGILPHGGLEETTEQVDSSSGCNTAYNRLVVEESIAAVKEAVADLRPGEAYYGECEDSRWAFNRRYWMKNNTVITNPGIGNPEIAKAEGPIDPRIGVFGVKNADGSWRALMVNISNHPDTVEGCLVSGDWCGVVRSSLEKAFPGILAMSLTSPQGNVNHFNPFGEKEQSGYDVITKRMGQGYAETIIAAMPGMRKLQDGEIKTAFCVKALERREVSAEEVATAREHAAKYTFDEAMTLTSEDLAKGAPHALKFFADQLLRIVDDKSSRELPVSAWKIGEFYLVSLPGEPFVEHAMYIREDLLQGKPCFVNALTSADKVGYIPNRFNFGRGGYETTVLSIATSSDTGNTLRNAAAELLQKIG